LILIGFFWQKCNPIDDGSYCVLHHYNTICLQKKYIVVDDLHRRHMIVIIFYVLLRIVRSIVLTTTVLSAILTTAFQEPLATLSQVSLFIFLQTI
jgi:hypothetical protein